MLSSLRSTVCERRASILLPGAPPSPLRRLAFLAAVALALFAALPTAAAPASRWTDLNKALAPVNVALNEDVMSLNGAIADANDAQLALRAGVEVEGKLLGERIHQSSAVPEGKPRAMTDCAGFDQRISHPGGFAHCFHRLADALSRDARCPQGTQGAQLGQVFEGVDFVGGNQSGLLPRG